MRHFKRLPTPIVLVQNAEKWNRQWKSLKQQNPGAAFNWYSHGGTRVNLIICNELKKQTQDHCSYCDAFPLGQADETIDHFKPKGNPQFLDLAYSWENLYWACADCQKAKGEKYSDSLLRPDDQNFQFSRFFLYNYLNHTIETNPLANDEEQEHANETLKLLDLNHKSRITARRHAWERWCSTANKHELDDFNYRFIFS
jgi:uncharacterized protein (TIGR02646 family)